MGIRNQKIVILPTFRSAALHQNANPLQVNNIPAFGQDIERESGLETLAILLQQILRTPRFYLLRTPLHSTATSSYPEAIRLKLVMRNLRKDIIGDMISQYYLNLKGPNRCISTT